MPQFDSSPRQSTLPPGIELFERGWLSSNSILLRGRYGTALIDSGYSSHAKQTLQLVENALGSVSLDRLLNTHLHSDHCGGNAALQERYAGLITCIPPGLSRHVRDWDPAALTYVPTGQSCDRFRFDDLLLPGNEVQLGDGCWEIHAAPGHDPHSIVLFDPHSRILISADALWENGFGIIFPELEGEEAFAEAAATFDLIEKLAPRTVIPGHGRMFATITQALESARKRLDHFRRLPAKHAQHAAKVLLKFKLLELQRVPTQSILEWAGSTAYFELIHRRYFHEEAKRDWLIRSVGELVQSGAAHQDGLMLSN